MSSCMGRRSCAKAAKASIEKAKIRSMGNKTRRFARRLARCGNPLRLQWRFPMDNLTHTAIGLFLSRAGLNRLTPHATPILLLAANAPDADIVTATGGALHYLHYHRHMRHAVVAMPVMALLPVLLVRLFARQPLNWVGAFAASMIGLASHLLLDWTNVYGVRWLLPFSERWLHIDTTNVFD